MKPPSFLQRELCLRPRANQLFTSKMRSSHMLCLCIEKTFANLLESSVSLSKHTPKYGLLCNNHKVKGAPKYSDLNHIMCFSLTQPSISPGLAWWHNRAGDPDSFHHVPLPFIRCLPHSHGLRELIITSIFQLTEKQSKRTKRSCSLPLNRWCKKLTHECVHIPLTKT